MRTGTTWWCLTRTDGRPRSTVWMAPCTPGLARTGARAFCTDGPWPGLAKPSQRWPSDPVIRTSEHLVTASSSSGSGALRPLMPRICRCPTRVATPPTSTGTMAPFTPDPAQISAPGAVPPASPTASPSAPASFRSGTSGWEPWMTPTSVFLTDTMEGGRP